MQLSVECLIINKSKYLKLISTRNYDSFKFLHPNIIENAEHLIQKLTKNLIIKSIF